VKALIEKGASVNKVTNLGSALTMAIQENRPENVAVLLKAGADPHVRFPEDADEDIAGKTPLEIAKANKAKKILTLLEGAKQPSAEGSEAGPGKLADLWKRIEIGLQQHKPKLRAALNPGASPKDLALVEKTVGRELPEDFKEAYRIHNGQKG